MLSRSAAHVDQCKILCVYVPSVIEERRLQGPPDKNDLDQI